MRANPNPRLFACHNVGHYESRHPSSPPEARADLDRLLDAVARGEHGAFDLIYEQLREPIQGQVRAVLRDPAQSEEATQGVLLTLWRTACHYYPAKGSAITWAMTIAHRRAIDRVRPTVASAPREKQAV